MRGHFCWVLCACVLSGCALQPDSSIPDGTYRNSEDGTALIVDGGLVAFHVPPADRWNNPHRLGRSYPYELGKDGGLRFWGSSNDGYYLRVVLDCRWRWDGSAFLCERDDDRTSFFARSTGKVALPPASKEQAVWLAAAKYVRANAGEFDDHPEVPLQILARTSYPSSRIALAQLKKLAMQGFCELSARDARQVLEALRGANYRQRSVRDVFEHRSEFRLVESRPEKGDHLGISAVVFDREATTAYLDLDIGGPSGSIVRMTRIGEEWGAFTECAAWTAY